MIQDTHSSWFSHSSWVDKLVAERSLGKGSLFVFFFNFFLKFLFYTRGQNLFLCFLLLGFSHWEPFEATSLTFSCLTLFNPYFLPDKQSSARANLVLSLGSRMFLFREIPGTQRHAGNKICAKCVLRYFSLLDPFRGYIHMYIYVHIHTYTYICTYMCI